MSAPPHLRLTESLVCTATGHVVATAVVQVYRGRRAARERLVGCQRRAAANLVRDPRYLAVYAIERIPMAEREHRFEVAA